MSKGNQDSNKIRRLSIVCLATALLPCALFLVLYISLPFISAAYAQAPGQSPAGESGDNKNPVYVKAKLSANVKDIEAGKSFKLLVHLHMDPGWHTYYKESGDAGMPTKIEWRLPSGFSAGAIEWPKPERFDDSGIITYGYHDDVTLPTTIKAPAKISQPGNLTFAATVKWLSCKDLCVPGQADVQIELPLAKAKSTPLEPAQVKEESRPVLKKNSPDNILEQDIRVAGDKEKSLGLPFYLLMAFVGGLILNIMPCVLPVISIKILGFMEQAREEPKRISQLGLTFSAGIVSTFLALALIVVLVKDAGQNVGWGFQFQHPAFLMTMAVVTTVFALSLFGLFYITPPRQAQGEIDKLACSEGHLGTFFKGVLATVLSTPCTAPFLGTALGFAFSQPATTIVLIFFTIGLGMSLPYLLLTSNPKWMRYLPKPGDWMETFKQAMGFILLGTVLWLLWVLGSQSGVNACLSAATWLLFIAAAIWYYNRTVNLSTPLSEKIKSRILSLSAIAISYYYFVYLTPGLGLMPAGTAVVERPRSNESANSQNQADGAITWVPFSLSKLNSLLSEHKMVFVDFTADWCLTCKVNEQAVLKSQAVVDKLKTLQVVTMKADWTEQDPDITKLLAKFGRSGVPLYVIFPAGKPTQPIVLPEIITRQIVLDKLDEAAHQ